MLIDLLPTPPAWAVISGVIGWDVLVLYVIWRWSALPEKRHRLKVPRPPRKKLALRRDGIERIDRDLW